jgi:hypothetical protein
VRRFARGEEAFVLQEAEGPVPGFPEFPGSHVAGRSKSIPVPALMPRTNPWRAIFYNPRGAMGIFSEPVFQEEPSR